MKSRDSVKTNTLDPLRGFLTDRNYINTNVQSPNMTMSSFNQPGTMSARPNS